MDKVFVVEIENLLKEHDIWIAKIFDNEKAARAYAKFREQEENRCYIVHVTSYELQKGW